MGNGDITIRLRASFRAGDDLAGRRKAWKTEELSQFFGCTPLGPVAWTGVIGATTGATAVSVLAPKWLTKTVGVVAPELE